MSVASAVLVLVVVIFVVVRELSKRLDRIIENAEETNRAVKQVLYPAISFDSVNQVEEEIRLWGRRWKEYRELHDSLKKRKDKSESKRVGRVLREVIVPTLSIWNERLKLSIQKNIDFLLSKTKPEDVDWYPLFHKDEEIAEIGRKESKLLTDEEKAKWSVEEGIVP